AAHTAKEATHGREKLLGDSRALEHGAHEDEQGHRDQHLVRHEADVARRQGAEVRRVEHAQQPAGQREDQRGAGERERDREADQERGDDAEEQADGEDLAEHDGVQDDYSCRYRKRTGSRSCLPARTRMLRANIASPCSATSTANTRMKVLRTNSPGMPPGFDEASRSAHDRKTYSLPQIHTTAQNGSRNSTTPIMSSTALRRTLAGR